MEARMKHTFVDNLVMLAELTIKPEKLEEFLDFTVENLKISRSYPGNIEFDILIDETRPNTVLFYEVWESAEVQQAYMAWRVQAGDLTTLLAFLDGEPKFTPLRSIAN
jgi:quinol monooxygenase YgiN